MSRYLKAAIKDLEVLTENELIGQIRLAKQHLKEEAACIKKQEKAKKELRQIQAAMEARLKKIREKNKKKGK